MTLEQCRNMDRRKEERLRFRNMILKAYRKRAFYFGLKWGYIKAAREKGFVVRVSKQKPIVDNIGSFIGYAEGLRKGLDLFVRDRNRGHVRREFF